MKIKLFISFFLVVALLTTLVSAIGVSPPRIIIDNMLKEDLVEKSVTLVDLEENSKLSILITGEGRDWVKIKDGTDLTSSNKEKELIFQIKVPKEVPNGEYKTFVQVTMDSEKKISKQGNMASVISGVMIEISLKVSDEELLQYEIKRVKIPDIEKGMPLYVIMDIDNKGNVLAKPEKIKISIIDEKTKSEIISMESKEFTTVNPFSTDQSVVNFNIDLNEGLYFANLEIKTNNDILEKKELPFNIFPVGTLDSSLELIDLYIQDNIDEVVKIDAKVKNTGKVDVNSNIVFEIYKGESLKKVIKSESKYIQKGQEKIFSEIYELKEKGNYLIKAYVEFNNKQSNTLEAKFKSSHSEISSQTLILIITVLLLGGYIAHSKIKVKNKN